MELQTFALQCEVTPNTELHITSQKINIILIPKQKNSHLRVLYEGDPNENRKTVIEILSAIPSFM